MPASFLVLSGLLHAQACSRHQSPRQRLQSTGLKDPRPSAAWVSDAESQIKRKKCQIYEAKTHRNPKIKKLSLFNMLGQIHEKMKKTKIITNSNTYTTL